MVKEGKKERLKVIPDGWLLFDRVSRQDSVRFPILLESDRGTAYRNKVKEHIASRIEFIKIGGVYSKLFGGEEVMVVYLTTGETDGFRESRRRAMCVWAQEVLKELRKEAWASVFRFGSVSPEDMYGGALFEGAFEVE